MTAPSRRPLSRAPWGIWTNRQFQGDGSLDNVAQLVDFDGPLLTRPLSEVGRQPCVEYIEANWPGIVLGDDSPGSQPATRSLSAEF